jgi:hypothetical protein
MQLRWETNVKNGVCGVLFDRKDIPMNKFMVTCLESVFHVFDARTQNPTKVGSSPSSRCQQSQLLWHSLQYHWQHACVVVLGLKLNGLLLHLYPFGWGAPQPNGRLGEDCLAYLETCRHRLHVDGRPTAATAEGMLVAARSLVGWRRALQACSSGSTAAQAQAAQCGVPTHCPRTGR